MFTMIKKDNSPKTLIKFYDTTLRDGEQMPEVAFSREKRIKIARGLDDIGIDEIEIGFSASILEQRQDMRAVVELGLRSRMLSLARPLKNDIDQAQEIGVDTVIIFAAISPLHLKYKMRQSYEKVSENALKAVHYATSLGLRVQFSIEDATRTDVDLLVQLSANAIKHGAFRIGLADTVGIATPKLMDYMVGKVVSGINAPVAVHCHNDFGLAVANSLAAVEAGASVLSTTMCGFGERSGNAATEECAVALELLYGYRTNLNLKGLYEVAQDVQNCTQAPISNHKPVVGKNSFRHEAGIHVAAVLREPLCYEPYDPSIVGHSRQIVLGKTSGRAALRYFAGEMAEHLDDGMHTRVLDRLKVLSESGKRINSELLAKIIEECK